MVLSRSSGKYSNISAINRSTGAVNYIGLGNQKETYSDFIDEFKQFADDVRKALNAFNLCNVDDDDEYNQRLKTINNIRHAISRYDASLSQISGQNTHPASLINGLRANARELSKVAREKWVALDVARKKAKKEEGGSVDYEFEFEG